MNKIQRALIMAGGTGGHVFPGLSLAHYLQAQGIEIHWLGTAKGLEAKVVPQADIPLHTISITGLRGKGIAKLLTAPWQLGRAIWQARRIIHAINPQVVIGMGGFASGPGGLASWLSRIPLIIHEQNATAGMTNTYLSKLAACVIEAFPNSFAKSKRVHTIGNPVRAELLAVAAPSERFAQRRGPLRLLVIGGSLGAQFLNQLLPQAINHLADKQQVMVYHQVGDKHVAQAQAAYAQAGLNAQLLSGEDPIPQASGLFLTPFIKSMAQAYAWADLVLCRAGALTIAELCAVGLGAILIPFPHAVDDHQTANANYFVNHQAGLCIQQADLTAESLASKLQGFIDHPARRLSWAQAAYQLRNPQIVPTIYQLIEQAVR